MKDKCMENGLKWKGRPETGKVPRHPLWWRKTKLPKTSALITSGAMARDEWKTLGKIYFGKALKVRIGVGGFNARRKIEIKNNKITS